MAHSKTEPPTPRRLEEARKRGQVAHSREVDTALVLLAAFAAFRFGGARMWQGLEDLIRDSLALLELDPRLDPVQGELAATWGPELILRALMLLLPLMLIIAAVSILGGFAQTGGVFSVGVVKPQFSRIDPLKGAKRTFASKQAYVNLVKSLVKLSVVGGVAVFTVRSRLDEVAALGVATPLGPSLGVLVELGFDIVVRVAVVLLVLAAADLLFQRYDLMGQLKMSMQEVKDELRQQEGDPQIRGRLAQLRRSFLTRVMEAVPQADVVLTNPTTYAVALKYDPTADRAPKVIARGERLIAQRMREVAIEHGIPVIENPLLARAIFSAVPVGQEITSELYEAVAEILAFVYRLRYPQSLAVA
ncbi:MAG: EscU/YscU/HrcU family type III secretion system export apparatus switch protein [Dehalococcoidia bacterium]